MVRIVVDSTADLTREVREKLTVVPISIFFGDDEYTDGVTIDHRKFYEMLIEGDVLPKTSQASPELFGQIYREADEAGDSVVVLTISSRLSGTYQGAVLAAENRKNVFVIDTKTVALGAGILAEMAVNMAQEGMAAEEIARRISEERENVHLIAMLDTLEYLRRGGRISKTAAFAGSLLSIKPVICISDGEVVILGKARGSRQGNNLLVREIEQAGGVDFGKPLLLGYTGLTDALLNKYIQDSAQLWRDAREHLPVTVVGSAVGTHVGPGAVAVAFFRKK